MSIIENKKLSYRRDSLGAPRYSPLTETIQETFAIAKRSRVSYAYNASSASIVTP